MDTMKAIKPALLALTFSCQAAVAVVISPGDTVSPNGVTSYTSNVSHPGGAVSDTFTFDLHSYSHPTDLMTFFVFGSFSGPLSVTASVDGGAASSFGTLSNSNGFQSISGTLGVLQNHTYTFTVLAGAGASQYTMAATVPEPESWAMLLSGLALVGYGARRNQRS